MTLCLPKSERVLREQEAEEAKQRGWAVGREASRLMHEWLDAADEKGSVIAVTENEAACIAAADLLAWWENHGITRYTLDHSTRYATLTIVRVN